MASNIWYTARKTFGPDRDGDGSWEKYLKWSKLSQVTELVSLDGMLNGLVIEPDFGSEEDWNHIVTEEQMMTPFFSSLEYVLQKTEGIAYVNILAVIKEPAQAKGELSADFEFVGYDLIERTGDISALTNCGGFDETFLPADLNKYGLLDDWTTAKRIQKELMANNPEELHADCFLYEVWRHQTIGRRRE